MEDINIRDLISEEEEQKLRLLYCVDKFTIEETRIAMGWSKKKFNMVKKLLNLTHDSSVHTKDEILNEDIEELAEKEFMEKYKKYSEYLTNNEINILKKLIREYYILDNIADKLFKNIETVSELIPNPKLDKFEITSKPDGQGLLLLSDWHLGMNAENYWNVFNQEVAIKQVDQMISETIEFGKNHNIEILNIINLGDIIHGIIHEGVRLSSSLNVVKQIEFGVLLIGKMLKAFSKAFREVNYTYVVGNHGRIVPDKKSQKDGENFEILLGMLLKSALSNEKNINFSVGERLHYNLVDCEFYNILYRFSHGNNTSPKSIGNDIGRLTDRVPRYIISGDKHHKEYDGEGITTITSPSFCGVGQYAKSKFLLSEKGQLLMLLTEKGIKIEYRILF